MTEVALNTAQLASVTKVNDQGAYGRAWVGDTIYGLTSVRIYMNGHYVTYLMDGAGNIFKKYSDGSLRPV